MKTVKWCVTRTDFPAETVLVHSLALVRSLLVPVASFSPFTSYIFRAANLILPLSLRWLLHCIFLSALPPWENSASQESDGLPPLAAGWRFWRDDRQERDERDLVYETPSILLFFVLWVSFHCAQDENSFLFKGFI